MEQVIASGPSTVAVARTLNQVALLEARDISQTFAGIKALSQVSLTVHEGEICALIGPNGAGKSSLLNVINGIYRPDTGAIVWQGQTLIKLQPSTAAHLGIGRTFQNIALFKHMSVADNVMTGCFLAKRTWFWSHMLRTAQARREERAHRQRVEETLEIFGLTGYRQRMVGNLAYGLQKRVELARAMIARPKLLLLDEPMAGMTVDEKRDMCRYIWRAHRELNTTVVLIEHDMRVVMDLADHLVVLDHGRKIADGTPHEVRSNQSVIEAYLGVAH